MRQFALVFFVVAMLATTATFAQTKAGDTAKPAEATLLPAAEISWQDTPGLKGGKNAALWTAPDKSSRDAFGRFPGGFIEGNDPKPVHAHPFGFKLVVLEGTLVVTVEGDPSKELGSRSYGYVPPNVKHCVICKTGADCVFFITYVSTALPRP